MVRPDTISQVRSFGWCWILSHCESKDEYADGERGKDCRGHTEIGIHQRGTGSRNGRGQWTERIISIQIF